MTGLEKIALQAASLSLASILSKVIWDGGGKLLNWMGKNLDDRTETLLNRVSEKYVQNYRERHGIIKVLGMREPVALEAVYTTVQFLDRWDIRQYESIESLEKAYRKSQSRSFQPRETSRMDGLEVANQKQYLMVLGGPGAGKSTFIRKIGLEALKGQAGKYEHECIPILLELKSFNGSEVNLEQAIAHEFSICGLPDAEAATQKLLERGKLLILLDGLDEVPTKNLSEAIAQIQNFVDRYDQNRYIASCRVAAYRHNFRRFTDVAMADFSAPQIKQFIFNWFQADVDQQAGTGQKCWDLMQKPEHLCARELAQTPLLLTLLCLVYDRSQNFPHNRSVLYRKALRVLLEEWASEKRILQDEIYQGLSTELEEVLLAEIAYRGFEVDRLFFDQREIVDQIKQFLANNLNAPRHLDGEKVLDAIAIQQGILVERAEDVFSFSHLTLQEYLTAQHIDDHRLVPELVAQHLTSERWQEVFLLVAGLMRAGADELLRAMAAQAQTLVQTPRLQALLQWADSLTSEVNSPVPAPGRRAAALFLVLVRDRALELARLLHPDLARLLEMLQTLDLIKTPAAVSAVDLARAINLARNLDLEGIPQRARSRHRTVSRTPRAVAQALTRALAQEFHRLQVFQGVHFKALVARLEALKLREPHTSEPYEAQRAYSDRLAQIWQKALGLDGDLVNLSEAELGNLETYLYINWLILRCKQAAVRVSPTTWHAIEAEMLVGKTSAK